MNTPRKLAALVGASALVLAMAGTAAAVTDYATVSDHVAFSSDANAPEFWGDNCSKLDEGQGDLGAAVDSYVLTADYGKVIVKAGSGPNANTVFNNPTAGQTVWADTNGNNTFDPGGQDGDKTISHIIFCDVASSSSSSSSSSTSFSESVSDTTDSQSSSSSTSFSQSVSDTTDVTQPPTDTIGSTGSGQQSSATWLLIAALGVLLGSVVVLAPARSKTRQ
jgi:hypothetical protein